MVDADPASSTSLETLHPVARPTQDDVEAVWGSTGRPIAALTTDGGTGYVSRGGDGVIDVLDTREGTVTGAITEPTPLDCGGYLAVARPASSSSTP